MFDWFEWTLHAELTSFLSHLGKFITGWIEMPLMRYVVQNVSYILILLLTVSASVNFSSFPLQDLQEVLDDRICYEYLLNNQSDCLLENVRYEEKLFNYESNTTQFLEDLQMKLQSITDTTQQTKGSQHFMDFLLFMWVIGNVVKEIQTIWQDGFKVTNEINWAQHIQLKVINWLKSTFIWIF